MSTYYNTTTNETRDFDDAWFAAAVAAGNPKVTGWTLRPAAPSHTSTQHPPEWTTGAWITRDKTEAELAAEYHTQYPDAEKYQVLDWLDDYGITSAHVEAALQSITDETQRRKALLRWHSVNRIPANNGFVLHVAKQLNIDHKTAWAQILAK
jgi:hypothetical protein